MREGKERTRERETRERHEIMRARTDRALRRRDKARTLSSGGRSRAIPDEMVAKGRRELAKREGRRGEERKEERVERTESCDPELCSETSAWKDRSGRILLATKKNGTDQHG